MFLIITRLCIDLCISSNTTNIFLTNLEKIRRQN